MLQERAMLAKLSISQWTARKHDRAVSREVDTAHGAKDAGRYNKLLIDKAALDPIASAAGAMRMAHYRLTLPWDDEGARLLPSTLFFSYTEEMRQLREKFQAEVDTFIAKYPSLKTDARARLGTLYDATDYPVDIANRFAVTTHFTPVPDAGDFRVDVGAENVEQIRREITKSVEARQEEAVKDCWARVKQTLQRYADRLSDEKVRLHDTMVENARDLVKVLPALNITNDPALASVIADIGSQVVVASTNQLRASRKARADTLRSVQEILARVP